MGFWKWLFGEDDESISQQLNQTSEINNNPDDMEVVYEEVKTQETKKKTKTGCILQHLKDSGSITSWEAINLYGATRLSSIIFNLRAKGHKIETVDVTENDRFGNLSTFARYVFSE